MRPDILVDSNLSEHFCAPVDEHYVRFIKWLRSEGHLVVCQHLIVEYHRAAQGTTKPHSLPLLVAHLQRHGRLFSCGKDELRSIKIPKALRRRLRSNRSDHDLLRAVMLSDRKIALSRDGNFRHDVEAFPGFDARAYDHPREIDTGEVA